MGKHFKNGKVSWVIRIQSIVLTILFPIIVNLFITGLSESIFEEYKTESLTIDKPFLGYDTYLLLTFFWFMFVLIGKVIKKNFILVYRYRFHILNYLILMLVEMDLILVNIAYLTLSWFGLFSMILILLLVHYLIFRSAVNSIKQTLYPKQYFMGKFHKLVESTAKYFLGAMLIILSIAQLLKVSSSGGISFTGWIGFLISIMIFNLIVGCIVGYMDLPYFIQGYYKWKYPEEYRKLNNKSIEEWYGQKYLNKHKDLLQK